MAHYRPQSMRDNTFSGLVAFVRPSICPSVSLSICPAICLSVLLTQYMLLLLKRKHYQSMSLSVISSATSILRKIIKSWRIVLTRLMTHSSPMSCIVCQLQLGVLMLILKSHQNFFPRCLPTLAWSLGKMDGVHWSHISHYQLNRYNSN